MLSDDNHVALLNSDKVVTPYAKKYSYAGVTLDYNGSNSTVERVNSTYSWKLTRDLRVEVGLAINLLLVHSLYNRIATQRSFPLT